MAINDTLLLVTSLPDDFYPLGSLATPTATHALSVTQITPVQRLSLLHLHLLQGTAYATL